MRGILLLAILGSACAQGLGVLGGWSNKDASNPEFMGYAWNHAAPAVSKHESNKGTFALVPVKILSARTQTVAGTNIELEIQLAPSKCPKTTAKLTATACPADAKAPTQIYVVRIFDQSWTKTIEVTQITKKN